MATRIIAPIGGALALGLCLPFAARAQTTYDFNADTGLGGSITLAAGVTGAVATSDIIAFDFTSAPTGTLLAPLSGTVANGFGLYTAGMLTVMGEDLYFDPPSDIVGSENLDGYYGIAFDNANVSAASPQPDFILTDDPSLQGGIAGGAIADVIYSSEDLATDPPDEAPEINPAGAIGALTLLAGVLMILRARREKSTA